MGAALARSARPARELLRSGGMDVATRAALEAELRRRFDAGDLHGAATEAIKHYGPELYGFLVGLTRDRDEGAEVFALTSETLWRALPGFRWDSTLRVWAYAIARHQFHHWLRRRDQGRRHVPLSAAPEVAQRVAEVTSTTPPYLRTDVKDGFAALRATLDADDQLLLGLRLESGMAWAEIARILADADADAPAASAREVAALRKRFERLKGELRALARKHALL